MADSLKAYQTKIAASTNPREITLRALVEINRAHAGYGLLLNWVYAWAIDSRCITKPWIKATNRFFYDRLVENDKKGTTNRRVTLEAPIAKKWGEGWHLALHYEKIPGKPCVSCENPLN
jgi:hypothetical protein